MTQQAVDFGKDISCTTALRTGQYSSGLRLVAEALYRRLTTPRGTLRGGEDEQNYGLDLLGLIGSTATASDQASLPAKIQAECLKDERVQSVTVSIVASVIGPSTSYTITIGAQTAQGPFSLVIAASAVSATVLNITLT